MNYHDPGVIPELTKEDFAPGELDELDRLLAEADEEWSAR